MMGCLVFLVAVFLAAWADLVTIRGLATDRAGPPWWVALAVLLSLGVAVGVWCEYQYSDRVRVFSFPVPAGFFRLEDGEWIDYVTPAPVLVASLNALSISLASLLPLSVAYFVRRVRLGR